MSSNNSAIKKSSGKKHGAAIQPGKNIHTKATSMPEHRVAKSAVSASPAQADERAAQQISRMEAIGQLAGGIAHDFNNLLTVILGHSEFLLKRNESRENTRMRVEEIRKAAERGAWLTSQLLAYSRNQILEPTVLQINSVLQDMDGILRCVLGEDVSLDIDMDENLGWTKVDPGKLQQIVLNLAGNARDAMPQGGRLLLETRNVSVPRKGRAFPSYIVPGEYVALRVCDAGGGMDSETRARVFEPFFTTKEQGKGTGLGLATVYGIVKQSGGYIWVESEVGEGAVFQTLLPRVPAPSTSAAIQEVLDFRAGGETVLLVEDDSVVRRMAAEVLLSKGYKVLVAPSGADALHLAEKHVGRLDLLLTDVVMPSMTGPELVQHFSSRFPFIRTLYMSGYTDDAIEKHGVRGAAARVLQKPFTHDMLARSVREALGPSALK
ncbi:MAG TPA: ATP-binding protein [Candidatus Acidoferrales bacterium]|nr:ATP-binding protein [Candidatus Acidoferrales bacterium]